MTTKATHFSPPQPGVPVPPAGLIQHWRKTAPIVGDGVVSREVWLIIHSGQWHANEQLRLSEAWVADNISVPESVDFRIAMRPKSKSIKERLVEAINGENLGEALRLVEQLND